MIGFQAKLRHLVLGIVGLSWTTSVLLAVPVSALSANNVCGLSANNGNVLQYAGSTNWNTIAGLSGLLTGSNYGLFRNVSGYLQRYDGVPGSWTTIGRTGYLTQATNTGLYQIPSDQGSVWKYNGSGTAWTQIGGPATMLMADGYGVFAVNPASHNVYRYNGVPGSWTNIGGAFLASFEVTNSGIYGIPSNHSGVWKYNGSGTAWTQIGGPAMTLWGGNSTLLATNPTSGDVFHYLGTPGSWQLIGGPGRQFIATPNGAIYGVAPSDSTVWQYTENGTSWIQLSTQPIVDLVACAAP